MIPPLPHQRGIRIDDGSGFARYPIPSRNARTALPARATTPLNSCPSTQG